MASGVIPKVSSMELLYEGAITANNTAVSVLVPGIASANVIMAVISGGAAPTIVTLIRASTTALYGGGGELSASAAQVVGLYITNSGDTVTLAIARNGSGNVNRTIVKIYKLY